MVMIRQGGGEGRPKTQLARCSHGVQCCLVGPLTGDRWEKRWSEVTKGGSAMHEGGVRASGFVRSLAVNVHTEDLHA